MYQMLHRRPSALARIHGGEGYPAICGTAAFYPIHDGVIVSIHIQGLPSKDDCCNCGVFAMHIHEGTSCTGTDFSDTASHLNLNHSNHPCHTGDLPPLFAHHGNAYAEFLTNRFSIRDILGRTIIIHENPDDFHTQPSGNAGKKIACGKILPCCCR